MVIENRDISSLSMMKKKILLLHSAELSENISQSKEKYRKIIQAGIAQWVKDFQSGHI
ncbi:hypothetical protein [Bacillus mojavensis]|uniref:hypothetical protein n=1 Tax=Bacillus mojavensis TaxID=72360 RepID=UPI002DB5A15E|nr:hypothetical protein [Bacillus mojavensis]MEC1614396.1 hypothetical protein [Bacillus mojavensis]MEC1620362.1 hypothetical protein [Bacillus mojavensis]MEC1658066.1 hypothetical protein [Bacillus mojavensis]MEC1683556.1 hypothetical protein [Bacillus mojavensis]MEC1691550.1 hypothetical protein [Bacillus mojavensis]